MHDIHFFNRNLEQIDCELSQEFTAPQYPVVAIIGAPRAGKSYIWQYLISVVEIGYISNIQAKFYLAPYLGALLEQEFLDQDYTSNFEGFYGTTFGTNEPHEWGWFWKKWLNISDDNFYLKDEKQINPDLIKKFAAMEHAKGKPVTFHNLFATLNLKYLRKIFPKLLVVFIERNPLYLINSYVRGRTEIEKHSYAKKHLGNYGQMLHFKPKGFEKYSPKNFVEECAISIKLFLEEIEENLGTFADDEVLRVDYDFLKQTPQAVAREFVDLLGAHGAQIKIKKNNFNKFTSFPTRNAPEYLVKKYKDQVEHYYEKYFR